MQPKYEMCRLENQFAALLNHSKARAKASQYDLIKALERVSCIAMRLRANYGAQPESRRCFY